MQLYLYQPLFYLMDLSYIIDFALFDLLVSHSVPVLIYPSLSVIVRSDRLSLPTLLTKCTLLIYCAALP